MEDLETLQNPSTSLQSGYRSFGQDDSTRSVRHAMFVINRVIRSQDNCDKMLQERISHVMGVLQNTDRTETALMHSRPGDVVFRIASRVARAVGFTL